MNRPIQLNDLIDAIIFAGQKHRGQIRKDQQGSPYITHPVAVAQKVLEKGRVGDRNVLLAALLHDTIEDTPTTPDEIRDQFGQDVLSIVLELTDDKSLPKDQRKQLQILHASSLSHAAKIIKLADKLVNCQDILHSPPKDWSLERRRDYIQWAADVVAQIRGTNLPLESAFDTMLAEAETELSFQLEPFETVSNRPWGPGRPKWNQAQHQDC